MKEIAFDIGITAAIAIVLCILIVAAIRIDHAEDRIAILEAKIEGRL